MRSSSCVRRRAVVPRLVLLTLLLACTARGVWSGGAADLAAVRRLLRSEEPRERAAALRRLAGEDAPRALDLLRAGLADEHPYVRRAAAGVLAATPPQLEARVARRRVRDLRELRDAPARVAACRVLALRADEAGAAGLLDALEDREARVRAAALRWLADPDLLGPEAEGRVVPALRDRLDDSDGEVRALALDALAARPDAGPPSPAFLRDADPRVRLSALEGSAAVGSALGDAAVVAVIAGLTDTIWSVRLRAAELAGALPDRRLLSQLVDRLEDERQRVARAAHTALVRLTRIPFEADPAVWRQWLAGDGRTFDPASPSHPARAVPPPGGGRTVARPRFLGMPLASRHVAFVLDASGSMARRLDDGATRWERACEELDQVLTALAETGSSCRTNVWVFQETVEALFPDARRPTRARRLAVRKRLAALEPRGRTALYDGIAAALAEEDLDTVVVLSDGAPSAGAFFTKTDLLQEVARANRWRRARIDVISIGSDRVAARWRTGLKVLAERTGGTWWRR